MGDCAAYNGIEVEWEVLCNDSAVPFPHLRSLPLCLASLADYPLTNVFALSFGGVRDRFVRRWSRELLPNICWGADSENCYETVRPMYLLETTAIPLIYSL